MGSPRHLRRPPWWKRVYEFVYEDFYRDRPVSILIAGCILLAIAAGLVIYEATG